MRPRLFCFGLGYSAEVLVRRLLAQGWTAAGTARQPERLAEIRALGADAWAFDADHPLPADALAGVTHLLTSVPPGVAGDPVLAGAGDAIRAACGQGLHWLGYLSTTAVYGDWNGAWVDESSALHPTSDRARRRVEAEAAWLALGQDTGAAVQVFRLAGIYGPGRNLLEDLRAGTVHRVVKPGQVFSRIHVDDIATVVQASIARPRAGGVYNVCDDDPAPPQDVITHAAALLGIAPPPEEAYDPARLSPMAQTFWADNKRVSNRLLHDELGAELAYPSYRDGLQALLSKSEASSENSATT